MIVTVPLKKAHMRELLKQPQNQFLMGYVSEPHLDQLVKEGLSYAILDAFTADVLFCGGVAKYWENRGECWAMFASEVKKDFLAIHRAVLRYFEMVPVKRVEATVRLDFEEGHRWMKSLGFTMEAQVLRCYHPNGDDVSLYSRIRES